MSPEPPDATEPQRPGAWLWVAVLTAGYAVSVVDRIGIGLLVSPIKRDLHLTDTMIGLIQGLAFGLFYIGLALPLGQWIDRGRRRTVLIVGIAIWSVATFAGAFASGAVSLFVARLFVGAGEATLSPAGTSLIADLFAPRRRPLAFGLFTVGVGLGTALAFLITGEVIALAPAINGQLGRWGLAFADWQLAFMAMALPGFVLVAILWLVVSEPDRRPEPRGSAARTRDVLRLIRARPTPFVGLMLGASMLQFIGTIMISWFPSVLIRSHGMTPPQVGGVLGPLAIFVGIPSALLAGFVIAWLSRWNAGRAPLVAMAIATVCYTGSAVAALLSAGTQGALLWFGVSVLFANWAIPATLSGLALLTPPRLRARMIAIQMMVNGAISLGIGPALTGYVADRFFPTAGGIALSASVLTVLAGLVGAIAIVIGYRGLSVGDPTTTNPSHETPGVVGSPPAAA